MDADFSVSTRTNTHDPRHPRSIPQNTQGSGILAWQIAAEQHECPAAIRCACLPRLEFPSPQVHPQHKVQQNSHNPKDNERPITVTSGEIGAFR